MASGYSAMGATNCCSCSGVSSTTASPCTATAGWVAADECAQEKHATNNAGIHDLIIVSHGPAGRLTSYCSRRANGRPEPVRSRRAQTNSCRCPAIGQRCPRIVVNRSAVPASSREPPLCQSGGEILSRKEEILVSERPARSLYVEARASRERRLGVRELVIDAIRVAGREHPFRVAEDVQGLQRRSMLRGPLLSRGISLRFQGLEGYCDPPERLAVARIDQGHLELHRRLAPDDAFEVDDARDTPAVLHYSFGKGLGVHVLRRSPLRPIREAILLPFHQPQPDRRRLNAGADHAPRLDRGNGRVLESAGAGEAEIPIADAQRLPTVVLDDDSHRREKAAQVLGVPFP